MTRALLTPLVVALITLALAPAWAQKGPRPSDGTVSGVLGLFIWTLPGDFEVEQNAGTTRAYGQGQMSFDESTGVATMSVQVDGRTARGTGTLQGETFVINWGSETAIHYTLGDAQSGNAQTLLGRPPGGGDVIERWRPQL